MPEIEETDESAEYKVTVYFENKNTQVWHNASYELGTSIIRKIASNIPIRFTTYYLNPKYVTHARMEKEEK
jgi:hypothetical protein